MADATGRARHDDGFMKAVRAMQSSDSSVVTSSSFSLPQTITNNSSSQALYANARQLLTGPGSGPAI